MSHGDFLATAADALPVYADRAAEALALTLAAEDRAGVIENLRILQAHGLSVARDLAARSATGQRV